MSHLIPPILSTTPPPLPDIPDDDDDFGDFAVADDPFHTDCEGEAGKEIAWSDESFKKSADNTSQDSVLSANTDSGLCSDSSPLPGGENNNCDHQPVICDVPLSKSIPQCDSTETSTKGENGCIPFSVSVNSADGESKLVNQPVVPDEVVCESKNEHQTFNNNNGLTNNFEEHCVKAEEDFDILQPPETEVIPEEKPLQNNEAKANDENKNLSSDWENVNNQAVNGVGDFFPEAVQEIEIGFGEPKSSRKLEDVMPMDSNTANFEFGDFESNSDQIFEDQDVNGSFVENQEHFIPFEEAAEPVSCESKAKLEENADGPTTDEFQTADDSTLVKNSILAAESLQNTSVEHPPPLSQDLDLDYDFSAKDDETTESFGFLDESPESQNSEDLPKEPTPESNVNAEKSPEFDEFGDFAEANEFKTFGETTDLEFDAFKDFTTETSDDNWALPEDKIVNTNVSLDDDDFGDFEEADDQFNHFKSISPIGGDEEEINSQSNDLYSQPEKIKEVVATIFDCTSPLDSPQALSPLSIHLKHLWPEVQDVQNTPALEFQWNNSKSHDQMLSSLGIDTRNILFGHQWNSSMPRFAANLGHCPLEPVKAADVLNTFNPLVPEQENVPAAQFDWNGSGLVNPLDSNLLLNIDLLWDPPSDSKVSRKTFSAAAQKVLSSLPDLSFLRASSLSHP